MSVHDDNLPELTGENALAFGQLMTDLVSEEEMIGHSFGGDTSNFVQEKVKMKKEHIRKRTVAKAANMLAKQSGDPLYTRLVDLATRLRDVRAAIQKKYSSKAAALVKKNKSK